MDQLPQDQEGLPWYDYRLHLGDALYCNDIARKWIPETDKMHLNANWIRPLNRLIDQLTQDWVRLIRNVAMLSQ